MQREVYIQSTMDDTMQPSLFYEAEGEGKRPLLVGLHTWSYDRSDQKYAALCGKISF